MSLFKILSHVSITVTDVTKARDFYTGVLGFQEIPRPAFDFPGIWYSLGGDLQLHIILNDQLVRPATEREKIVARYPHFALWTEDVDGTARRIEELGLVLPGRHLRSHRPAPALRQGPGRQHGRVPRTEHLGGGPADGDAAGPMKIGLNLITFGPGASEDALARWAGFAETVGYHFLMLGDHVTITPDVQGRYPAPFYDPFTTLAWLAGLTRRVELGFTVIVLPYRHPLETARMAATLDRISGGRLIFGIGVGWARQEFEVLGLPFEKRGAMTDDYIGALKAAWTQDVASYQGRFVSFKDIYTAPRPLQTPHPPIWVGGSSEAALRRTVRHGNAWHPIRSRIAFLRDEGMPKLRAIAEKEGRPVPALCPRIRLRLTDAPMPEETRLAGEGTMDQVRRDFAALEKLGVPYLCLDTFADDIEGSRNHEQAWRMLASLAEHAFDLDRQTLR